MSTNYLQMVSNTELEVDVGILCPERHVQPRHGEPTNRRNSGW